MNSQSSKSDITCFPFGMSVPFRNIRSVCHSESFGSFKSFGLFVEEVIGLRFLVQEQLQGLVHAGNTANAKVASNVPSLFTITDLNFQMHGAL